MSNCVGVMQGCTIRTEYTRSVVSKPIQKGSEWLQVFIPNNQQQTWFHLFNKLLRLQTTVGMCFFSTAMKSCIHTGLFWIRFETPPPPLHYVDKSIGLIIIHGYWRFIWKLSVLKRVYPVFVQLRLIRLYRFFICDILSIKVHFFSFVVNYY